MKNTANTLEKIAAFIIEVVQRESKFNGFQYIVKYEKVEESFGIKIDTDDKITEIIDVLFSREEVADVQKDPLGFDVVLCTEYAPNYDKRDYETN